MAGMNHWGSEGPPPEAYSRVTNPERFRPLHAFMVELIGRLERTFDVERVVEDRPGDVFKGSDFARPGVRLRPRDPGAAPIVVAFTTFPGLRIRAGRWYMDAFPGCGCDACAETLAGEIERLARMVDDVTAGRFREAVWIAAGGQAWQKSEFLSPEGYRSNKSLIARSQARQILGESERLVLEWRPWPRRGSKR